MKTVNTQESDFGKIAVVPLSLFPLGKTVGSISGQLDLSAGFAIFINLPQVAMWRDAYTETHSQDRYRAGHRSVSYMHTIKIKQELSLRYERPSYRKYWLL